MPVWNVLRSHRGHGSWPVAKIAAGIALLILPSLPQSAVAQLPLGALVGVVQDSTGARLPGVTVTVQSLRSDLARNTVTSDQGEFRIESLPPDTYRVTFRKAGWIEQVQVAVPVAVGASPSLTVSLVIAGGRQVVNVRERQGLPPVETTSSVEKTIITEQEIDSLPLAHRSFANIAYFAPMTEPVEPSDPTKARITAVSFEGSSGLNVDLSVDGGDNNDDYIGGFLQNFSPEAIQEFVVRTAQYNADTSRTNGGSVIIVTRRGTDRWHGGGVFYERATALNARNGLDNPEPDPKAPYSRQDGAIEIGGPLKRGKLWFFSSLELLRENASIAYSPHSTTEFRALSQLTAAGEIPGVSPITAPSSTPVPFRDQLFDSRIDWKQSDRSQWFLRGSFDLNHTDNNLVQQATLPSTGATTRARYYNLLANQQHSFSGNWLGSVTLEASTFTNHQIRNSNLGFALAFPFSATALTTSGFETFGDNQFVTPITAFPVDRKQEKYQLRYDVTTFSPDHAFKFGVNFIHEPVLSGQLADTPERLVTFPNDPSYYLATGQSIQPIIEATPVTPGFQGSFSQNVQRLGFYAQDSWRVRPNLTFNLGARYDTTFGLFIAEGHDQDQNAAVQTARALGIDLSPGVPHDYRKAVSPRIGLAYSPGASGKTVIRAGFGLYYNDLAQNGWVEALQAVNTPFAGALLGPEDSGAIISPDYHSPYDLQASAGFERQFSPSWDLTLEFEHHKGNHQYRAYQYVPGFTLPSDAPSLTVYRTDNRSRYDGFSVAIRHHMSRLDLNAHYTLASASTWGSVVGELFDYVNGVSNPLDAFGPGDYGPSGEDVRHRFVLAAVWNLPKGFQVSTLGQAESARPFTLSTPVDVTGDGVSTTDRAVVNGVQTSLDELRGTPYVQVDLRVSRDFRASERLSIRPFVEFFNVFNRSNPGNNYIGDISAEPVPVNNLFNATAFCLNAACTESAPIRSPNQLRVPAGTLGDFFGPGTTVGIPFAAQLGVRVDF